MMQASVNMVLTASVLLLLFSASVTLKAINAIELFASSFRTSTERFTYGNNAFGTATKNGYSSGRHTFTRSGGLIVQLGGIDNQTIKNISGGWITDFTLPTSSNVLIDVRFEMNVSAAYEFDEYNQVLCSIDGTLFGKTGVSYLEEIYGTGTGGRTGIGLPPIIIPWKWVKIPVGVLTAGNHRLILGSNNNQKTYFNEASQVTFFDINLHYFPISVPMKAPIKVPMTAPVIKSPVLVPVKAPVVVPPVLVPIKVPLKSPTKVTRAPTPVIKLPVFVPVKVPVVVPPVMVPIKVPLKSPTKVTKAPVHSPFPPSFADLYTIRINAGSDSNYIDPQGNAWVSDKTFHKNGQIFNNCPLAINGTELDELYCKERYYNMWLDPSAKFQYVIPLPKISRYLLRLHFAETFYTSPKQRTFDVYVGGTKILQGLDIYSRAGFATALITLVTIETSGLNTPLVLEFVGKVENPKISGIEVMEIASTITVPTAAPVVRPVEILINCGGSSFDELYSERTWGEDKYFIGGLPYSDGSSSIMNTVDDQLYQTERYGEFQYEIPVPKNGLYTIILHFAELHWTRVGERLFNIHIENDIHMMDFDILARTNNNKYQSLTFKWSNVTIVDQFVTIALTNANPQVNHPKLSGIEVLGQ